MSDFNIIGFKSNRTGNTYNCIDVGSSHEGGFKRVLFAPDRSYAIGVFMRKPDAGTMARLEALVGPYRSQLFGSSNKYSNDYWSKILFWPYDIVSGVVDGEMRLGIVMPCCPQNFYFDKDCGYGIKKGQDKTAEIFSDPYKRNKNIIPVEGTPSAEWRNYFRIALSLASGVSKMHKMGLAHADLSGKNVLVDPTSGSAAIIDLDGLVVPDKFKAEGEGTPGYIAPEILSTMGRKKRFYPSVYTDRHALSVIIYQLLLCRHPLEGRINFTGEDDILSSKRQGLHAVFVENPHDKSTRYDFKWAKDICGVAQKFPYLSPWRDLDKLPYSVLGPYMSEVIEKAFVFGLHAPHDRPSASVWEMALEKTIDLLHPCYNPKCISKWFVFDPKKPVCPFCGSRITHPVPMLKFKRYGTQIDDTTFVATERGGRISIPKRLVLWDTGNGTYNGLSCLYPYHARRVTSREEMDDYTRDTKLAYVRRLRDKWYIYNRSANSMWVDGKRLPPPSSASGGRAVGIELRDGMRIQLDGPASRILEVEMVR